MHPHMEIAPIALVGGVGNVPRVHEKPAGGSSHFGLRDGGEDTRRPPATLAEWAAKWSGLFRLRHGRDAPERFEERPYGPMTAAWYR